MYQIGTLIHVKAPLQYVHLSLLTLKLSRKIYKNADNVVQKTYRPMCHEIKIISALEKSICLFCFIFNLFTSTRIWCSCDAWKTKRFRQQKKYVTKHWKSHNEEVKFESGTQHTAGEPHLWRKYIIISISLEITCQRWMDEYVGKIRGNYTR